MQQRKKIVIVDNNPCFIDALELLIEGNDTYQVIAKLTSGNDTLEFKDLHKTDIVLIDIEMPGMNGIDLAKRIDYLYPQLKKVAMSMYQDEIYLEKLIGAGFKGFVNKAQVTNKLFYVLNLVFNNELVFLT